MLFTLKRLRIFLGSILLVAAAAVQAADIPVTVTINSVMNISAGDSWLGAPDFYARIYIDGGAPFTTPIVFNSTGFVATLGWSFTKSVPRVQRGGMARIRIELKDFDSPLDDTLVDIDPATCRELFPSFGCAELSVGPQPAPDSRGMDVVLNLRDGSWVPVTAGGDSSSSGSMACSSGADSNAANICFSISLGTPTPETITVGKTTDSDPPSATRPACQGGCTLRDAVNAAESRDTIKLPASPVPYELTLPASALFDPGSPEQDVGSHLQVRQALLTIKGPDDGGIAVIRQTQANSRVFDVHANSELRMDHVTITSGGAANNSTAYPSHVHGGGIHNHGTILLRYVTITGNRATFNQDSAAGGGGIYNAESAKAFLANVTIAGNVSSATAAGVPLGGGIAGMGEFHLHNTIIANNTFETPPLGGSSGSSNCSRSQVMKLVDEGGNLQFPGNDCGVSVTIPSRRGGPDRVLWLPLLPTTAIQPLLPLDTQWFIFVPAPGGNAIEGGRDACGPTDQVGNPAPWDGNGDRKDVCDAGAIEFRPLKRPQR